MAVVASMIANTARDPKKRSKPFTPADFLPEEDAPERPKDWRELQAKADSVMRMFGGKEAGS